MRNDERNFIIGALIFTLLVFLSMVCWYNIVPYHGEDGCSWTGSVEEGDCQALEFDNHGIPPYWFTILSLILLEIFFFILIQRYKKPKKTSWFEYTCWHKLLSALAASHFYNLVC